MNDAITSLLITSVGALFALLIRYCFYSKCDRVKCCCFELHRAVGAESTDIQEVTVNMPTSPRNSQKEIRV
jgi:hypothetical protein